MTLFPDAPPADGALLRLERRALKEARQWLGQKHFPLKEFIRIGWPVLEPSRKYEHGWHIDAMCEHLEAVVAKQIIRLAIAVPPGTMKSLTTAVFFHAWLWGPMSMPSARILGFSHTDELATRDALRARRLMQSTWYQTLWGSRWQFLEDENVKTRYSNDQTGFRISDHVGGGTGDRGDVLVVDDPHQVEDPESEAKRQKALLWLHETLPSRTTDPEHAAIIVIHHRLHAQDMIGDILSSDMGYEYLCLPMEFESDRRCKTSIGWQDPRTKEGELLFPARFPPAVIERDRQAMTNYAWAGQMQQRPAPRGGGMIHRDWFEIVGAAPADCYWVRWWDLAATEELHGATAKGAAWTAGVLLGRSRSNKLFYLKDIKRARIEGDAVKRLILQTAAIDQLELQKKNYTVYVPQDPGQAGKVLAKDLINLLAGYNIKAERETGDKVTRAQPFADQAEGGNVKLIEGKWIRDFLDECEEFPAGAYADQVDAASGAFGALIMYPKYAIHKVITRGAM